MLPVVKPNRGESSWVLPPSGLYRIVNLFVVTDQCDYSGILALNSEPYTHKHLKRSTDPEQIFFTQFRPRWPSGKVSTSGPEVRNPIPLKIRRVWGLLHAKSYVVARWCGAEVWRGMPAQVSSSSSDRGAKLRGPSLNSPRVASKRDVNIT
ncbi:hypothetical protein AVEN_16625-1 [Araneus ventricosus]|uniref:Uncharacterized protein n=1 Tax=Araneus ventricosus TaxID=182803 RepID=A0A4Y2VP46_ARAVE|nr:hypothetical protein AVEN_16625-1 [Araneus ventricosus]